MSPPTPNTPEQVPHTPVPGGLHNDEFETSLSDDEAIIALAQSTTNGNSKAIATALSSNDEEEAAGEERNYLIEPPPPSIHPSKAAAINVYNS